MPGHESAKQASVLMGFEYQGADHFVSRAMEWLLHRADVICPAYLFAGGVYTVSGDGWYAQGDSLANALAAAVQACQESRLRELAERSA